MMYQDQIFSKNGKEWHRNNSSIPYYHMDSDTDLGEIGIIFYKETGWVVTCSVGIMFAFITSNNSKKLLMALINNISNYVYKKDAKVKHDVVYDSICSYINSLESGVVMGDL